jgi:gas vesicle protein
MKKAFSFLNGFITGALVGGLLMLLFTPESGRGFQDSVKERFQTLKDEINAAAQEKRIELESELTKLRQN